MVICVNRKNKIEQGQDQDFGMVFAALIKSRFLIVAFTTENIKVFNGALCSVVNDDFSFVHFLFLTLTLLCFIC